MKISQSFNNKIFDKWYNLTPRNWNTSYFSMKYYIIWRIHDKKYMGNPGIPGFTFVFVFSEVWVVHIQFYDIFNRQMLTFVNMI